ncbi:MAG: outer membrane protein assembly factor BamA, partial [Myxococcota bacterium]
MGDLPKNKPNRRPKILKIKIKGNKATESNAIKNIIKSKAGNLYSPKVVAQDIKTLWRLKKFNDIEFSKEKTKKGIILYIKVVEKRTIRSIIVHGNDKLSLEEVNKVVTVKPNTILDESAVKDNVIKIKQRYQKDGFYLINIKHKIKRVKNNKVDIHYYIEEGPRVKVGGVSFSGNKRFPSNKLRSGISTRVPGVFSFLNDTDGVFDKNALDVDILKIKSLYFNHGYVRAKVGPPRIQFSSAQNKVYIHIPIVEGPRYKIKEISFGGTLLSPDKDLMKRVRAGDKMAKQELLKAHYEMVKSKSGNWFNRGQMAMDLKRITTYYRDLGYAYANVIPQSPIDDAKREISVKFIVKPGKKVYIERIEIQGNTSTRDKVIRREMIINEGDLFSVTRLDISKKRIKRLGYFKDIEIKQKKGSDTDKIRVIVKIQERSTGTFNIGAGFSTVENFIAQAQITQRNFLGRGQTLMLRAALSSLRQYFTLQFTEPHFFDTDWYFSFKLYNSIYAFESFNRETYGGALTWGYSLTPFWRVLLTYKLEDVSVDTSNSG